MGIPIILPLCSSKSSFQIAISHHAERLVNPKVLAKSFGY
jgi:hypothetical protein